MVQYEVFWTKLRGKSTRLKDNGSKVGIVQDILKNSENWRWSSDFQRKAYNVCESHTELYRREVELMVLSGQGKFFEKSLEFSMVYIYDRLYTLHIT